MLEFDLEIWCAKHSYVTLTQTKSVALGFVQNLLATARDTDKLQQIQSIEKANGLNFD